MPYTDAPAVAADLDHLRAAVGGVRPRMPPSRTNPVSCGRNGSDTSYRRISPVPWQEMYSYRLSR
jgi:hypothetical protein